MLRKNIAGLLCISAVILLTGCGSNEGTTDVLQGQINSLEVALQSAEAKESKMLEEIGNLETVIETMKADALSNENIQKTVEALQAKIDLMEKQITTEDESTLLSVSVNIVNALKNKDMETLSAYVHPYNGIRFTPYSYIDEENDLVFTKDQILIGMEDSVVYEWGAFDGSGEPIEYTFQEYYERFVFDADYSMPHDIGVNQIMGSGNSMNNISEIYPDAMFVEFHFSGFNPEFEGMDWKSLRLVLKEIDGNWYLLNIIHDQWTI
ncbi:MAG: hypothetical protein JXR88_09750 [Clostridia bacterium]|nr:hypothetical protein [Clostridia bacterium]